MAEVNGFLLLKEKVFFIFNGRSCFLYFLPKRPSFLTNAIIVRSAFMFFYKSLVLGWGEVGKRASHLLSGTRPANPPEPQQGFYNQLKKTK